MPAITLAPTLNRFPVQLTRGRWRKGSSAGDMREGESRTERSRTVRGPDGAGGLDGEERGGAGQGPDGTKRGGAELGRGWMERAPGS